MIFADIKGRQSAMTPVNTLKGPVDSSKLGRVLVHEHLFRFAQRQEKTIAGGTGSAP
jgi:predicted metal-dependent phosphotriesterase family hydrolase